LYLNTQAQSVCLGVDTQLLLVSTTSDVQRCFEVVVGSFSIVCYNDFLDVACDAGRRASFSEVVRPACTLTITSLLTETLAFFY